MLILMYVSIRVDCCFCQARQNEEDIALNSKLAIRCHSSVLSLAVIVVIVGSHLSMSTERIEV